MDKINILGLSEWLDHIARHKEPQALFNHKSKTFMKNKRKQVKINKKRKYKQQA